MQTEKFIVDYPSEGLFRVHRSVFTSSQILQLEQERIFDRCWLYLGHESEVAQPGDFRRRTVAGRPLFFVRGSDGQVRAFLNTCRHRGALVCRQDEGHAEVFQCFYHAWTYNEKGELVGVPDEAGYDGGFPREEMGLKSPPRLESYRGFYFVSFNPDVEYLVDYLAGAREYIDLVLDQSEVGWGVIPGGQKYSARANWKQVVENTGDAYHGLPLHQTYFAYLASLGAELPRWKHSQARELGNGHAVIEFPVPHGRPIAHWGPPFAEDAREEIAMIRGGLVERYGEERATRMADLARILRIYPNLYLLDIQAVNLRVHWPVTIDRTDVTSWQLAPVEEADARLARRLNSFVTFYGPGGFGIPDDIEAVESCQAGYGADQDEWSDYSRGIHREAQAVDDLQSRAFYRQWYAQVQGLTEAVHTDDGLPARSA